MPQSGCCCHSEALPALLASLADQLSLSRLSGLSTCSPSIPAGAATRSNASCGWGRAWPAMSEKRARTSVHPCVQPSGVTTYCRWSTDRQGGAWYPNFSCGGLAWLFCRNSVSPTCCISVTARQCKEDTVGSVNDLNVGSPMACYPRCMSVARRTQRQVGRGQTGSVGDVVTRYNQQVLFSRWVDVREDNQPFILRSRRKVMSH